MYAFLLGSESEIKRKAGMFHYDKIVVDKSLYSNEHFTLIRQIKVTRLYIQCTSRKNTHEFCLFYIPNLKLGYLL